MTDGMVVVEWADLTGTGFSPQRRRYDAPEEYRAAAEGLLMADLCQPPEGIHDTKDHPIWTLRQVSVGPRRTWCFAVQGRLGDDFGVAGTCRFAFALDQMDALEAWKRGIEAARVRLAPTPMSNEDLTAGVRRVLLGVAAGLERIPVGLEPALTARVVPTVLAVLPEPETRNWSWSTCALLPPGRTKRREISGSWPEEFRSWDPRLAAEVTASFQESPTTDEDIGRFLGGPHVDGFEELVDQAIRGKADTALRRTSRDVEEVIARIRRSTRELEVEHVADMVITPMGAEELNDHYSKLLARWAAEQPEEAVRLLRFVPHTAAAGKILNSLVEAEQNQPRNLLNLPTAEHPGLDAWHDRLIEILRSIYTDATLEKLVTSWIERIWADPEDAAAGRELLRRLGMGHDKYPALYRARPSMIVGELAAHGKVTDRIAGELGYEARPLDLLAGMSPQLPPMAPKTAAQLVHTARSTGAAEHGQAAAIESIATGLTKTRLSREAAEDTEEWVRSMVSQFSPDDPMAAQLLTGGLRALGEVDPDAPRGELLDLSRKIQRRISLPRDVEMMIEEAERRRQSAPTARPSVSPWAERLRKRSEPSGSSRHNAVETPAPQLVRPQAPAAARPNHVVVPVAPAKTASFRFGRDLTQAARDGALAPVVGRGREIDHVLQVIARRSRNNPVLVGEPGVGKTAVIEGLAQRIAAGKVPAALNGKVLYAVDPGVPVAELLAELGGRDDVILVTEDRIPGEREAPLLRSGLQIISTGTEAGYRRRPARDLQPVVIAAPTIEATVVILQAARERYENHHRLRIGDDALAEAARLADRHLGDRRLPTGAFDLIDDAAAWLAVHEPESVLHADRVREALDRQIDHRVAAATLPDAPGANPFRDQGRDAWMMA